LDYPTPPAFALKDNLKEPMPKIIVTETFASTYELEVADLDEATIQSAIDANATEQEPRWVGTCATDEDGSEVLDY